MAPKTTTTTTAASMDSLSHPLPYPPFSVDWVDDSSLVITGGGGASKTGVPNGVSLYQIRGGVERLVQLRFHPTGDELAYFAKACPARHLLAMAIGNRVELLSLEDLRPIQEAPVLEIPKSETVLDPVMVIAFSPNGQYMAVGAHDGLVRLVFLPPTPPAAPVEIGALCQTTTTTTTNAAVVSPKPFRDITFHPSGELVLASSEDGSWQAWWIRHSPGAFHLEPALSLTATSNVMKSGGGGGGGDKIAQQDHAQGLFYTCRCGRFSPDGKHLFTVHYVRRGPKGADKHPRLTNWRFDFPTPTSTSTSTHPTTSIKAQPLQSVRVGTDPLMCLDIQGPWGVAGDCSGRTILFSTSSLACTTRDRMHNFGVTSLSFSPPPPPSSSSSPPSAKEMEKHLRIASTSGDKTLRLQYLHPSLPTRPSLFSSLFHLLFSLLYLFFLYLLATCLFAFYHQVPLDRALDSALFGLYEPPLWMPVVEWGWKGWAWVLKGRGWVEQEVWPLLFPYVREVGPYVAAVRASMGG